MDILCNMMYEIRFSIIKAKPLQIKLKNVPFEERNKRLEKLEKFYRHVYLLQKYSSEYYEAQEIYERTDEYSDILEDDGIAPYHDEVVSIREYIQIQYEYDKNPANSWHYDNDAIAYEQTYLDYRKKHSKYNCRLTNEDYTIIDHDYNRIMPQIIQLYESLHTEKNASKNTYIIFFKIIIYIGYFICWGYILYKSFHTLDDVNILLYILEKIHTHIIKTTIWFPLKLILFLIIIIKFI